jgi:transcriptional regulator with XRE-family HTH domain
MSEDDRKARSREVAQRLGENLRRTRRRVGLSQEQVAVRASLHRTEVGLLERGGRVARVDTLVQLAGAMSVHPADLLDGIGWTPGDVQGGSFEFEAQAQAPRRPPA